MILSDIEIKKYISDGTITVEGFIEELLNPSTLDIRLSSQLRTYKTEDGVLNPFEPMLTDISDIPSEGIILQPGVLYLSETYERIKLPNNIGAQVLAKSSLGRLGLDIIIGPAGWIDPGFEGKVVLELRCTQPILIKRFMRIAQLKFEKISQNVGLAYGNNTLSKYQNQKNIQPSLYYKYFQNNTLNK